MASRSVTGGVNERDVDLAHGKRVAGRMGDQVRDVDLGRANDPRHFGFVHVNRHVVLFEETRDAVNAVTHHCATDVVGVVVRREHARQCHPICLDHSEQLIDCIGRVHDHALPRHPVAQQINVIDHLSSKPIAYGEVTSRKELAEIEPVIDVHWHRLWRTLTFLMNAPTPRPESGDRLLVGDRLVGLSKEMIDTLSEGGKLVPLRSSGAVLVVPADVRRLVDSAVHDAVVGFVEMQRVPSNRVDRFFTRFADLIDDDDAFAPVLAANARDVESARGRGRSIGRLEITPKMRTEMSAGLRMWAGLDFDRLGVISTIDHDGWSVESWRAPLGVVAFVFEGRPNVFADATGVLKSGNAVVFRIGSDALGTARAIRDHMLIPALDASGLPRGAVKLVDSAEHAAGWALFDDSRLALAVARGSGQAVDQLGEIARQCGTPVSLHGTGGAWLVSGTRMPESRLRSAIVHSLDRKVCNTLNTIVALKPNSAEALAVIGGALSEVAVKRGGSVIVHAQDAAMKAMKAFDGLDVRDERVDWGQEWEWDEVPEVTVMVAESMADAIAKFNQHSPRFVLSILSDDEGEVAWAWENSESPFFGDGFTRWVDGQFALERPELGLANWQYGRLLGRGGVLSGDAVHSIRLRVRQTNPDLHR